MPGMWGAVGEATGSFAELHRLCSRSWPGSRQTTAHWYGIGAHAHGEDSALCTFPTGTVVALDGEWSAYRSLSTIRSEVALGTSLPPRLGSLPIARANVATLESAAGTLHLAVECSGSFPLYIAELPRGLLFSSLLRPLASIIRADPDPIAILQFLRDAYTCNGRTMFSGIRRLLPGQVLVWQRDSGSRIVESSTLWASASNPLHVNDAAEQLWVELTRAVTTRLPSASPLSIMMSAGWDSRTLFACLLQNRDPNSVLAYSHGDTGSRELSIVARLCEIAATPYQLEPIDDDIYSTGRTATAFDRTETLMFPHWHRAGELLAGRGITCVTAGVYGEILGGHYGGAMLASGAHKIAAVAASLLGEHLGGKRGPSFEDITARLRLPHLAAPAALSPEFTASLRNPLEELNQDIVADVQRLRVRGVSSPERLLEAFISEHRGSHFINAQLLSARAFVDVALPFADDELLAAAAATPIDVKIHNRLNRQMLRRHAADLLRAPLAATLVAASAPILIQEATRLCRKVWEDARWRAHFDSGQRLPFPRLGWVNFEFLRSGRALQRILDGLTLDIWDGAALQQRIREVTSREWRAQLHPIFDNFARIATIDRLLAKQ